MFSINHAYSHSVILSQYLGLVKEASFLGEIQHSFWLSDKNISSLAPSVFSNTLYLWGGSFFKSRALDLRSIGYRTVAIGDPFLYQPFNELASVTCDEYLLLMPKYNRQMNYSDRLIEHRLLIAVSKEFSSLELVVRLHSSEYGESSIRSLYQREGIRVLKSVSVWSKEWMRNLTHEVIRSKAVITNYIGAHVFRTFYLGRDCFVTCSLKGTAYDAFSLENSSLETKLELSRFELGTEFFCDADLLESKLSYTAFSRISTKARIAAFDIKNGRVPWRRLRSMNLKNEDVDECLNCGFPSRGTQSNYICYFCSNYWRKHVT